MKEFAHYANVSVGDEFHAIYDCINNDIQKLLLKYHEQLSKMYVQILRLTTD